MNGQNPTPPVDLTQIAHSIGKLTGAVQAMHEGTTARIEDIRRDIARMEQASNDRISRTEQALSTQMREQGEKLDKRVDSIGTRVTNLEAEDKRLIEKTARLGALGGGVGGMLAAGAVELIKHALK